MERLEAQVEQSICDLRDKLKLSQISEFAGAVHSAIKTWTKGETSPTLVLADKLIELIDESHKALDQALVDAIQAARNAEETNKAVYFDFYDAITGRTEPRVYSETGVDDARQKCGMVNDSSMKAMTKVLVRSYNRRNEVIYEDRSFASKVEDYNEVFKRTYTTIRSKIKDFAITPITEHKPTEAQLERDRKIQAEVDAVQLSPEDEAERKYWKAVVDNSFKDPFINKNAHQKAKHKGRHCRRDKKGRFV